MRAVPLQHRHPVHVSPSQTRDFRADGTLEAAMATGRHSPGTCRSDPDTQGSHPTHAGVTDGVGGRQRFLYHQAMSGRAWRHLLVAKRPVAPLKTSGSELIAATPGLVDGPGKLKEWNPGSDMGKLTCTTSRPPVAVAVVRRGGFRPPPGLLPALHQRSARYRHSSAWCCWTGAAGSA